MSNYCESRFQITQLCRDKTTKYLNMQTSKGCFYCNSRTVETKIFHSRNCFGIFLEVQLQILMVFISPAIDQNLGWNIKMTNCVIYKSAVRLVKSSHVASSCYLNTSKTTLSWTMSRLHRFTFSESSENFIGSSRSTHSWSFTVWYARSTETKNKQNQTQPNRTKLLLHRLRIVFVWGCFE